MHPDPDDPHTLHDHSAYSIPPWCLFTRIGRAYARRKVGAMVRRECAEQGYARTGPLCFHFGVIAGAPAVIVHYTARNALARDGQS